MNGEYMFMGTDSMLFPDHFTPYRKDLNDTFLRQGALAVVIDWSYIKKPKWNTFKKAAADIVNSGIIQTVYGFPKLDILISETDAGK